MKLEDLPKYTRVCGPIRELLGLKSTEEFTVILWTSPEEVPEEGSFLLLKLLDADGNSIICEGGAYENGRYLNYGWDGGPRPLDQRMVLGWSYYPYDNRPIEELCRRSPHLLSGLFSARRPTGCMRLPSLCRHQAGGRQRNPAHRRKLPPESCRCTLTERGVSRGSSPWTRSLGTFSGAREGISSAGTRPGDLRPSGGWNPQAFPSMRESATSTPPAGMGTNPVEMDKKETRRQGKSLTANFDGFCESASGGTAIEAKKEN